MNPTHTQLAAGYRQYNFSLLKHDPYSHWGLKHSSKVKTKKEQEEEQRESFDGFKAHVNMNAECGIITSLEATSGEAYEGHFLPSLVDHDLKQEFPVETVAGDKGYDDGDNHFLWR